MKKRLQIFILCIWCLVTNLVSAAGPSTNNNSGTITGTGGVSVSSSPATIMANLVIDPAHAVRADGPPQTYYPTIQGAINAVNGGVVRALSMTYPEGLLLNRGIALTLKGGYDPTFNTVTGVTTINGPLIVGTGSVIVDGLIIAGSNASAPVPNVVALGQTAAQVALVTAGFAVGTISQAASSTAPTGSIISQTPAAGTSAVMTSAVDLVVSTGPVLVLAPNVVGLTPALAHTTLSAANLTVGVVTQAGSTTVPIGSIARQIPGAGTTVPSGSAVALTLSVGPSPVPVPNVVGLTQANAQTALVAASVGVGAIIPLASDTVPVGSVIDQTPTAGTLVVKGTNVTFLVSTGPAPLVVPNVVGMTQAHAPLALAAGNLTVGATTQSFSATVPTGIVISQNPVSGVYVAKGSAVALVVSLGPAMVLVPNVVGLAQGAAQSALVAANLAAGAITQANSDTVPAGSVISQNPAVGVTAANGSAVALVISTGPAATTAPNVVGMTQAIALSTLTAANLTLGAVTQANTASVPAGDVISQYPPSGASILRGSPLSVVMSQGAGLYPAPTLSVAGIRLVGTTPVSGTLVDYAYRVTVRNDGTGAQNVTVELTRAPDNVKVMTSVAGMGAVPAGSQIESGSDIVLRYDQTYQVQLRDLTWLVRGMDATFTGMLLGPATAPALGAYTTYVDATLTAADLPTSLDAYGQQVLRTQLGVQFDESATIGQVNTTLASVGGKIVNMLDGSPFLVVQLPDPGTLANLGVKLQMLGNAPGVLNVLYNKVPVKNMLPPNPSFQPTPPNLPQDLKTIDHHLAVRGHAAWNVKSLFDSNYKEAPQLIVADFFGSGMPDIALGDNGLNFTVNNSDYATNSPDAALHGYNVVAIYGASFGGDDSWIGLATGMFPNSRYSNYDWFPTIPPPRLRAVDINITVGISTRANYGTMFGYNWAVQNMIKDIQNQYIMSIPPRIIVSNSLGVNQSDADVKCYANTWITETRRLKLEDKFLLVGSGGNDPTITAKLDSVYNYANASLQPTIDMTKLCLPVYVDPQDHTKGIKQLPGLTNMLTVEGRYGATDGETISTSCASGGGHSDSPGGDISAIGSMLVKDPNSQSFTIRGVFLPFAPPFPPPPQLPSYAYGSGSSFAAPQAAGVAAMVWTANPLLSVTQVKNILINTTSAIPVSYLPNLPTATCSNDPPGYSKPIDAYAAVLATDNPNFDPSRDLGKVPLIDPVTTAVNAPARLALLDVASIDANGKLVAKPDGKFDQTDIMMFLQEFEQRKGQRDYSRYDLNGDGRTGEAYPASGNSRFDLNGDNYYSDGPSIPKATQIIEGIPVDLDEVNPADITILIYYAYSPLYTGSEFERAMLLAPYLEKFNKQNLKLDSIVLDYHSTASTYNTVGPYYLYPPPSQVGTVSTLADPTLVNGFKLVFPCPDHDLGTPLFSNGINNLASSLQISPFRWQGGIPVGWNIYSNFPNDLFQQGPRSCPLHGGGFLATVPSTGEYWQRSVWHLQGPPQSWFATYPTQLQWNFQQQRRVYYGEPDLTAQHEGGFVLPDKRWATLSDQWGITGDEPFGINPPFLIGPHAEFQELLDLKSFYGASATNKPGVTIKFLPK